METLPSISPRLSRMALASLVLGIASPAAPFLFGFCASPFVHSPSTLLFMTARVGFLVSPVGSLAAFAAGVAALREIRRSKGLLKGTKSAVLGLVLSVSWLAFLAWQIIQLAVEKAN